MENKIDAVMIWVDGSDLKWQKEKIKLLNYFKHRKRPLKQVKLFHLNYLLEYN